MLETRVSGIPCKVRVTHYEPSEQVGNGVTRAYAEFELYDANERRAEWLENKMTPADVLMIEKEIENALERKNQCVDC